MNVTDYFKKGQKANIEIELGSSQRSFDAVIEEINDEECTITLSDDSFAEAGVKKGISGILWGKKGGFKYSVNVDISQIDGARVVLIPVQSRSHLRVDCFLIVDLKKITEEEYKTKRSDCIHSLRKQGDDFFLQSSRYSTQEFESITSDIPPEIAAELQGINKKLDFIIKWLMKTDEDNIFNKKPVEVNLSGSGLKIKTADVYAEGDYLEMRMILPLLSGVVIDVIGQVVRTANIDQDIKQLAIRFAAINEDDREMIIRYVFKRQRELLRARDDEE